METAKVDIRKLQQLNDRINQCLDALNQVRLSVHGLSHTTGAFPQQQYGQQLGGQQFAGFPAGQDPRFMTPGIGAAGLGAQGFAQPYGGGLSHTGGFAPFAQSPGSQFAQQWNPQLNPMLAQQAAIAPFAQFGGLSHSGIENFESLGKPTWDPLLQAKVAQTFPYAQYAVPPIVSLY